MIKAINKWHLLFLMLYVFFSMKVLIAIVTIDPVYANGLKYFYTTLFFIGLIFGLAISSLKEKLIFVLFSIFCLLTFFLSHSAAIYATIVIVFFIFMSNRISKKNLSKLCLTGNVIISILLLPFLALSDKTTMADYRYGERVTYGFVHPNYTGVVLLFIFISICWCIDKNIKDKGVKLISAIVFFLPILFLMDGTKARTTELLLFISFLTIVLSCLIPNFKSGKKINLGVIFLLFGIVFFQFYTAMNYSSAVMGWMNEILAGRISLSSYLYLDKGFPHLLYGTNIEDYEPIDFFFIELFYTNGILISLIFLLPFVKRVYSSRYDINDLSILVCSIVTTLTQKFILVPCFAVAIFLVFSQDSKNE